MRRLVLIVLWLAACKERGTIAIAIPDLDMACRTAEPTGFGVYLVRALDCEPFKCGLAGFNCTEPDCIAGCADGFCTPAELSSGLSLEPPGSGEFKLVLSYVYDAGENRIEQGLACFDVVVDADGTESMTIDIPEKTACCM